MLPRSPQLLEDIRDAAAFIVEVTQGIGLERYRTKSLVANKPRALIQMTTRTARGVKTVDGVEVEFAPTSLHCYTVGRNTLERSR
jgi:hypothetical protein